MLRVDECGHTASPLRIGHDMEGERRLAAGFRTIDLRDAAARDAADTDGGVEVDGARWNRVDAHTILRAQPHDGPLAAALLDLRDRQVQRLLLVVANRRNSHASHLSLKVRTIGLAGSR